MSIVNEIDWTFVLLVLLPFGIVCGVLGFEICGATHRQRGLEVDRPVTDVLPMPPAPIVVPDHVPEEWETFDHLPPAQMGADGQAHSTNRKPIRRAKP